MILMAGGILFAWMFFIPSEFAQAAPLAPRIITPSQTVHSNSITVLGTIDPIAIPGLLGYWSFDQISPNLTDESGNNHTAVMQVGNGRQAGKRGDGGWFTGSDYASLSSFNPIPSSGFTWMAWVKTTDTNPLTRQNIITYLDTKSCEDVMLGLNNTNRGPGFTFKVDSFGTCPQDANNQVMWQPGTGVQADQWYHVVGVMDYANSTISLYVNGELKSSQPWIPYATIITRPMTGAIGGHPFESNSNWKGGIDEVKMFSRPLTVNEIRGEYDDAEITITGGASPVTATVFGNSFSVNVPLALDTVHTLSASATYGSGAISPVSSVVITTASTATLAPIVSTPSQTVNAGSIIVQGVVGDYPSAGLLGAWSFNENTGTTATDSSSYSNTANLVGAGWGEGILGSGAHFSEYGQVVDVPDTIAYAPATGFTWSAWVKPGADDTNQAIITSYDAVSCDDITLGLNIAEGFPGGFFFKNDYLGVCPQHPNGRVFWEPAGGIQLGQWYYVTAVMDYANQEISLYVNGIKRVTQTWAGTPNTRIMDTKIGGTGSTDLARGKFKGDIDEVKMYNRPLTASEILTLALPSVRIINGSTTITPEIINGEFSASIPLAQDATNTVEITTRAWNDIVSAVSVITVIEDSTAPLLTSRTPDLGDVNVNPGASSVRLVASEPIAISASNIHILPSVGELFVVFNSLTKTATISSENGFGVNSSYTITITGVTDIAGNPLPDETWSFTTARDYSVPLATGWNLVSIPLTPNNTAITTVLAGVASDIESVWTYDSLSKQWLVYRPAGEPLLNNLATMTAGYGYFINYTGTTVANITGYGNTFGSATTVPPSIKLYNGWNLIGFWQRNDTISLPAKDALSTLTLDINDESKKWWTSLWKYDTTTQMFRSLGYNDIMRSNEGYWVFVKETRFEPYTYAP